MSRITDALRQARNRAGMTQRDLAASLGLSYQFINDIELGRRDLPTKYYGGLPDQIRGQVIDAAIAELMEQADKLERMR